MKKQLISLSPSGSGGGGGTKKYLKNYIVSLCLDYNNSSFVFRGVHISYVSDNNIKRDYIYTVLSEMQASSVSNYIALGGGTAIVDGKTYYLCEIYLHYSGYSVDVPYLSTIINITDNTAIQTTSISNVYITNVDCRIEEL